MWRRCGRLLRRCRSLGGHLRVRLLRLIGDLYLTAQRDVDGRLHPRHALGKRVAHGGGTQACNITEQSNRATARTTDAGDHVCR